MTVIVVHDYSGHPGQAQLSRALARRGYEVVHQHCPSYATGKGALQVEPGDPATLCFEPCAMEGTFAKYSVLTRIRQELSYGRRAARAIPPRTLRWRSSATCPCWRTRCWRGASLGRGVPMVFWHQDIYSEAIGSAARRRLPVVGELVARLAERLERTIARRSEAIVAISPTFLERLAAWGVDDKTTVVPNWAPIEELPDVRRRMGHADGPARRSGGAVLGHVGPEARSGHLGVARRAASGVASRRAGRRDLRGQGARLARGLEACPGCVG